MTLLVVVVVTGGSVTTGSGMVKLPMGGNKEPKLLIAPKGLWKDQSEWVNTVAQGIRFRSYTYAVSGTCSGHANRL